MLCRYCEKDFEPRKRGRKNTGFCSKKCCDKWRYHNVYASQPKKFKKICQQCGNEFETNNETQKFCSRECRGKSQRGRTVYEKECLYCKTKFQTIYPKNKFCTSTCAARWAGERRRDEYFCEYCGKPRHSDHPNRNRFCSQECATKSRYLEMLPIKLAKQKEQEKARQAKLNKICPICGKHFVANPSNRIYCSDECSRIAPREMARRRYEECSESRAFHCAECGKLVIPSYGDSRREYCSVECMRRASHRSHKEKRKLQMKAAYMEPVGLNGVYERAGGVCEICGLPVPRDASPENYWGATRDHIVPLSKGGLHKRSNCQLAHRICNSLKLDTVNDYKINWQQKLIEEPGRWNEQMDDLWRQLGVEWDGNIENLGSDRPRPAC